MILHGQIDVNVEKVSVAGAGAIILTGPSSCGKGEVAKQLRHFLSIPEALHFSMGNILRTTIDKARNEESFRILLESKYGISSSKLIDNPKSHIISSEKYMRYFDSIQGYYNKDTFSELDWLEFCVNNGLLIPDRWTVNIINAVFETTEGIKDKIFIVDGYPRTVVAAEELLATFERFDIPMFKVIHLSITKNEMKKRASHRNRADDTDESLESRYQFYIDNVQPSIDYMKETLGSHMVKLIDAHQAVWDQGNLDLDRSINNVVQSVLGALDLPKYLLQKSK